MYVVPWCVNRDDLYITEFMLADYVHPSTYQGSNTATNVLNIVEHASDTFT